MKNIRSCSSWSSSSLCGRRSPFIIYPSFVSPCASCLSFYTEPSILAVPSHRGPARQLTARNTAVTQSTSSPEILRRRHLLPIIISPLIPSHRLRTPMPLLLPPFVPPSLPPFLPPPLPAPLNLEADS